MGIDIRTAGIARCAPNSGRRAAASLPFIAAAIATAKTCAWLAAACLLVGNAARADEPPLRFSADTGIGYDGNVANAGSGTTLPATGFGIADVDLQYKKHLPLNTQIVLRGSLGGEQYFHYAGLSNAHATGMGRLFYRPDSGFYAPTFALWGSAAQIEFGSRMRDSAEYRGGAFVIEQLTTKIDTRIGGNFAERDSDSRVFDGRGTTASLDFDWLITRSLTNYIGYGYRYGDVFSSGAPALNLVRSAIAIEADDAFGGAVVDEFAYRFRGHSQIGTLGFNYSLNLRYALDLEFQDISTSAAWGNHYNHPSGMLNLLARF